MARGFNGTDMYMWRSAAIATAPPFSVSCWFNANGIAARLTLFDMVKDDGSTSDIGFSMYASGDVGSDPVRVQTANNPTYGNADTTSGFSASTWHHAGGVWADVDDRRAYLDGGNKGTDATSVTPASPTRTSFAAHYNDSSDTYVNFHAGRLAEMGIWNVALTDAEMAVLGQGYSPLLVRPQSLVCYWPLVSRQSSEPDILGNHPLTLVNSPTIASLHPPVFYDVNSPLILPDITNYPTSLINLRPMQAVPPTSDYATISLRNRHPVLTFEKGYDQYAMFDFIMPKTYSGNGLAVVLHHSVDIATVGSVKAGVSLERIGDGQQDVDSDGFASDNFQYASVPTFTNEVTRSRIRFGDGADIDSIAAGEKCRLKVTRLSDDTAPGAWQLHMVDIRGK